MINKSIKTAECMYFSYTQKCRYSNHRDNSKYSSSISLTGRCHSGGRARNGTDSVLKMGQSDLEQMVGQLVEVRQRHDFVDQHVASALVLTKLAEYFNLHVLSVDTDNNSDNNI